MTIPTTLAAGWVSYETRVLPPHASDRQRRDMCGAFYAGALIALNVILKATDGTEEEGMAKLDALYQEVMMHIAGRVHDIVESRKGG